MFRFARAHGVELRGRALFSSEADRPKPMLKRRVSFDEAPLLGDNTPPNSSPSVGVCSVESAQVLYMQHMVPVVPNQIPSPTPGSNASNGSNSSEEAGG